MSSNKIKYLVADTSAFINNVQLHEYAEKILTVPAVINEVKNKRQVRRLVVLPFDLEIQEPSSECLHFVTNFAKKTGDYTSLSAIDLKVIALTYQLEKENVGTKHLRQEPIISKIIASKEKPETFIDKTPLPGFCNPVDNEDQSEEELEIDPEVNEKEEIDSEVNTGEDESEDDITEEELINCLKKLDCQEEILVSEKHENIEENVETDSETEEEQNDDNGEDDDSGWITPSNIQKKKKEFEGTAEEEKPTVVACMSTDYAIQNVLKQINLNVSALNGRVIRHLKTYILRCYACFKTTSVMTKIFCPNCGNKTLKRVAVSMDENGQQVIHINTRRPLTAKFKNQSIPRPKGGKHSRNPILCEDQPIPKQMPSRVAKTKTNALDEDYIAGYSPFVTRDVDSKSALLRSQGNIKQWAKNNVYEEQRRKKNCSRLVK